MASLIFFYGMGYQGREQPDPKPRGEIAHGFGALPGRLPAKKSQSMELSGWRRI